MAQHSRTVSVTDFSGGLNFRADQVELAANEFPYCLNLEMDGRGGLKARSDWLFVGPALSRNQSTAYTMHRFVTATYNQVISSANVPFGYNEVGLVSSSGTIYVHTVTADGSNNPVLTSAAMTGSPTSARSVGGVACAQWQNTLYMARGVASTPPKKWSGVAVTNLTVSATGAWQETYTSPTGTHQPLAEHMAAHSGFLWVAATSEDAVIYPSRVRFSHFNFPESWASADYIEVPGVGDIKGLIPFGDKLIVVKDRSLWAILGYDKDSFQLVNITYEVGAMSERHCAVTDDYFYFVNYPRGVLRMDRNGGIELISEGLTPLFNQRQMTAFTVNASSLSYSGGKVRYSTAIANASDIESYLTDPFGDQFTVGAGLVPVPTVVFVHDPSVGGWVAHSGCRAAANDTGAGIFASIDVSSQTGNRVPVAYVQQSSSFGFFVRLDGGTWAGDSVFTSVGPEVVTTTTAPRYLRIRWLDLSKPTVPKRWLIPELVMREQNGTFGLTTRSFRDWDETTVVTSSSDSLVGTDNTGVKIVRSTSLGLAKAMQLLVTLPATGQSAILAINFRVLPRRQRA